MMKEEIPSELIPLHRFRRFIVSLTSSVKMEDINKHLQYDDDDDNNKFTFVNALTNFDKLYEKA